MALVCPRCGENLIQIPRHGRLTHRCPRQHGQALATSVVRRWLMEEARPLFDRALASAPASPRTGRAPCPRCRKPMGRFRFGVALNLDACPPCGLTWFDRNEHETLPNRSEAELSAEEDVAGADIQLDLHAGIADVAPALFGIDLGATDQLSGEGKGFPLFTILLVVACTVVTHLARAEEFRGFVYRASEPFAGAGLPALLSLFAHADLGHLVGNMLFFLFPASLLEATYGERVLLEVFFLAGAAGLAVFSFCEPGAEVLGASGAIAGVFTVICLTQPRARSVSHDAGLAVPGLFFYRITYYVPMWLVFAGFLAEQYEGYLFQRGGVDDHVAYGAHLGGVLAGVAYVFATDLRVLSPARRR